jgi:hypothetical protein
MHVTHRAHSHRDLFQLPLERFEIALLKSTEYKRGRTPLRRRGCLVWSPVNGQAAYQRGAEKPNSLQKRLFDPRKALHTPHLHMMRFPNAHLFAIP